MSHTEIHPVVDAHVPTFARRAMDARPSPNFGVFETDQRLADAVGRALLATGRTALREVVAESGPDAVVLRGRVQSYYEKQLAQATAQQVAANRQVVNEIEVVRCRELGSQASL